MSLVATTKTEAVNQILRAMGASPVNDIDNNNSLDVSDAVAVLDETSREVQEIGWHFNTEHDVELSRNADNHLPVAANAIRVDVEAEDRAADVETTQRGLKLYDTKNRTFVFSKDLKAKVVYLLDWTDLPEVARNAIAKRAAIRALPPGREVDPRLERMAASAWASLVNYEADNGDHNIFDSSSVNAIRLRRQPLRH